MLIIDINDIISSEYRHRIGYLENKDSFILFPWTSKGPVHRRRVVPLLAKPFETRALRDGGNQDMHAGIFKKIRERPTYIRVTALHSVNALDLWRCAMNLCHDFLKNEAKKCWLHFKEFQILKVVRETISGVLHPIASFSDVFFGICRDV